MTPTNGFSIGWLGGHCTSVRNDQWTQTRLRKQSEGSAAPGGFEIAPSRHGCPIRRKPGSATKRVYPSLCRMVEVESSEPSAATGGVPRLDRVPKAPRAKAQRDHEDFFRPRSASRTQFRKRSASAALSRAADDTPASAQDASLMASCARRSSETCYPVGTSTSSHATATAGLRRRRSSSAGFDSRPPSRIPEGRQSVPVVSAIACPRELAHDFVGGVSDEQLFH